MLKKSKNIQKFKDYPWILTFNHFLNNCADWLAKYGYKLDCCNVSWTQYPTPLISWQILWYTQ